MILPLFRKNTATEPVYRIYSAIVAQSRQPVFFADWGVPDTLTGRFDMISLHMALLFMRLRRTGKAGQDFAQSVFDLFFKDMDRSLREMGVGDLSVPKRIQKMGALFYGLLTNVADALDANDRPLLEQVLQRNVLADVETSDATALAAYLAAEAGRLAAVPTEALLAGHLAAEQAA